MSEIEGLWYNCECLFYVFFYFFSVTYMWLYCHDVFRVFFNRLIFGCFGRLFEWSGLTQWVSHFEESLLYLFCNLYDVFFFSLFIELFVWAEDALFRGLFWNYLCVKLGNDKCSIVFKGWLNLIGKWIQVVYNFGCARINNRFL